MTDTIDLIHTISDVRRAMPRNAAVMKICNALEKCITEKPAAKGEGIPSAVVGVAPSKGGAPSRPATAKSGFNKTAWMRVYMRQRRAKAKAKTKVKRK